MSQITRRTILSGIATATAVCVPGMALASPRTQKEIALRVHDLAAELSELLDELDGGQWYVRVSPTYYGNPTYKIQPVDTSAKLRVEQGLSIAAAALNELQPGAWRREVALDHGFAIIVNDTKTVELRSNASEAKSKG
jgi:hypothetical protein